MAIDDFNPRSRVVKVNGTDYTLQPLTHQMWCDFCGHIRKQRKERIRTSLFGEKIQALALRENAGEIISDNVLISESFATENKSWILNKSCPTLPIDSMRIDKQDECILAVLRISGYVAEEDEQSESRESSPK